MGLKWEICEMTQMIMVALKIDTGGLGVIRGSFMCTFNQVREKTAFSVHFFYCAPYQDHNSPSIL